MNLKIRVKNLIEKHRTKDPFKLAKRIGINVVFKELGDVKGFFKVVLRRKYIFINSNLTEFEQKLVCAHELGHALYHSSKEFKFMIDRTKIIRKSRIEDEANEFASWLLFDDNYDDEFMKEEELSINSWIFEEIRSFRNK